MFRVIWMDYHAGRIFMPHLCRCPVFPIRLSGGWINLSPRMESAGIEFEIKIRHKTQNVNAKPSQCQCWPIVSGRSCRPSPYIFDSLYISFSADHMFEKTAQTAKN